MTPGSSWAVIKPCPSKADPFGVVWGTKPIYLNYCPSKEINAATSLMELELLCPLHDNDRRNTALLCDNEQMPLTGHAMDRLLQLMLTAAGHTTLYSWQPACAACAACAASKHDLLRCIGAQTQLCHDCAAYVFASMEVAQTSISTTSATGCETSAPPSHILARPVRVPPDQSRQSR